jgi:hypothetical protein
MPTLKYLPIAVIHLARKEQIKCVCIGGNSNVPITNFTVFENVLMIAMALFMQFYH